MYTIEDIFSPLDADVNVQTHFNYASSERSSLPSVYTQASPTTFKIKKTESSEGVPDNTKSIISSRYTMSEFEKEIEAPAAVKRGWRFYGTFACLALLNLICAIDATILSVALPVRSSLSAFAYLANKVGRQSPQI
jgi:hypothetical protein